MLLHNLLLHLQQCRCGCRSFLLRYRGRRSLRSLLRAGLAALTRCHAGLLHARMLRAGRHGLHIAGADLLRVHLVLSIEY